MRSTRNLPTPQVLTRQIKEEFGKPSPDHARIIELNNTMLSNKVYIFQYETYYNLAQCHTALTNYAAARSNYISSIHFDFRKTEGYELLKDNPTMIELNKFDIFYNFYNVKRADIALSYMQFLLDVMSNTGEAISVAEFYITSLKKEPIPPLFKSMETAPAYKKIAERLLQLKKD
ncbi:MAG: hypothetical protein AABZ39_06925 [Spirochaetota bacterium]